MKKSKTQTYDKQIHDKTICSIVLGVVFLLCLILNLLLEYYKVQTVYVEGNEHYTAQQVRQMVEKGRFGDNTLFLSAYYKNKAITGIPFVERMDVEVMNRNTIKITVYEKSLAGYVEYLGNYLYFDKDGIVVESSNRKTVGIPLVSGLRFDHFVMHEELPVENREIFKNILTVTQMLNKYGIVTDRIYFDDNSTMILYFAEVRVNMGSLDLLEEKIQRLDAILPKLEGEKGVLHLEGYSENSDTFTFTRDEAESGMESLSENGSGQTAVSGNAALVSPE